MLETLYKKAKGYDVEEVICEYSVDENGEKQLSKEKHSIKHIPPDLSAIKAYMELKDSDLQRMGTENLMKEKIRLLKELKKSEGKHERKQNRSES